MEESSEAKEAAISNHKKNVNASSVIDLVDDSDGDDGKEDGSGKTETECGKKRKSSLDSHVIDLAGDGPTDGNSQSTRPATNATNQKESARNRKKRARTNTTTNVEVIDLVDDAGIDLNGKNDRNGNHFSGEGVHQDSANDKTIQRSVQRVVLDTCDNAILTNGKVESIHKLMLQSKIFCWTCLGSNATTEWRRVSSLTGQAFGSPAHIQQPDAWSCGYRNYQMMLSALLPRLSPNHSIFSKLPRRTPPSLPTVVQIQSSLEDAWNQEGFDPDGARHYQHRLRNKTGNKAKIGAVEVVNLCWYHGIDAAVVQFLKCEDSRRLLPWFVLAYFVEDAISPEEEACRVARNKLSEATAWSSPTFQPPSIERVATSNGSYPKPPVTQLPLYLQWEGHSVTVVGIEIPKSSMSTQMMTPNLLILDPLQKSQKLQSGLDDCHTSQSAQGNLEESSCLPACVKLPWQQISRKDLQIVVCTERSMPFAEREACKSHHHGTNRLALQGRVVTAAQDAVRRHLGR